MPRLKVLNENGRVILEEPPPTRQRTRVVVMFLADEEKKASVARKGVKLGSLAGQGYRLPEHFNEPLDDLSEYR